MQNDKLESGSAPAFGVQVDLLSLSTQTFEIQIADWKVPTGSCAALIGRNGSGKTTILETLLGLRRETKLNAKLLGIDVKTWAKNASLRKRLGVLLQRTALPQGLYVRNIVTLQKHIYARSSDVIYEELGIPELSQKNYDSLSRGEQQRVDLFFALAHEPELIILDEPFTGLDQRFARICHLLLRKLHRSTILMACHSPLELSLADIVVWVENGAIKESLNPETLREKLIGVFQSRLTFSNDQCAQIFCERIENEHLNNKCTFTRNGTDVVLAGDEADIRHLQSTMPAADIVAMQYGPTTLEDLLYRCAHLKQKPESEMEYSP